MSDPVTLKRDQIVQWNCSSRCWQEGGPHDEGCEPTRYYHETDYDSLAAQLEAAQKALKMALMYLEDPRAIASVRAAYDEQVKP